MTSSTVRPAFDRQRVIVVALICALVLNMVVPIRQAHAIAPAIVVPAAVGTFVGVVAVGAIAMDVFGYTEQSEETMAYAQLVWGASSQYLKDSVMESYNAAVAAGSKTMTLSAQVMDYFALKMRDMTIVSNPTASSASRDWGSAFALASGVAAGGPNSNGSGNLDLVFNYKGGAFITSAGLVDWIRINYTWTGYASIDYRSFATSEWIASSPTTYIGADAYPVTTPSNPNAAAEVAALVGNPGWVSKTVINGVDEKTTAMRDSFPAAIPVPAPADFVYTPTANPGTDVYQRDDGTLADSTGRVYSPDQVQVKTAPRTRVATDAKGVPIVDAAGVPVVAVPVGATGVGTAAVPGTLVNVRTGEAVQTKTGDAVANPPLDWASQPTTAINWAPLKMTGSALTRVFPFSIPWDVYAQLKIFDVQPKTPVVNVDLPNFWRAGDFVWNIHFKLDFAMFDPVALGIRWIGNIAFTVGLALAMRRFMPQ